MKYFCMDLKDAVRAQREVWCRRSVVFGSSSIGLDTSVWTSDPAGEVLFRAVLNELGIRYQESDQQQVVTGLEWFVE